MKKHRDVYTGDFIGQPSSIPIWSNIASYQNPPVINDVLSEKLQLAMFDGDFPAHKQSFFGDFAPMFDYQLLNKWTGQVTQVGIGGAQQSTMLVYNPSNS